MIDKKKDKKESRRYYQKDENEKVDYYDLNTFIRDKNITKDN